MSSKYSVTSNTVKLLKHLNTLKNLQNNVIIPIMVHIMPTHRCQLNCSHCCFKNRKNLIMDMDFDMLTMGLDQFYLLGTKSIELTGGGEPVLYPYIYDFLKYALEKFNVGVISNGLAIKRIEKFLPDLSWLRLSLNTLDYEFSLDPVMKIIKKSKVPVSMCYIWNKHSNKHIKEVADFAKRHKSICRVGPDCIQPIDGIKKQMAEISATIQDYEYLFLSDFNVTLNRRNENCYIHMIKPAFYTDGYIYPCPSAELAVENNKQINKDFRLCHAFDIYNFYTNKKFRKKLEYSCSYCKYSKQQDILEDLLTETNFNEFA